MAPHEGEQRFIGAVGACRPAGESPDWSSKDRGRGVIARVSAVRAERCVLIVGGGFSGAAVATHLALRAASPTRIVLFDPTGAPGRGVAYAGDEAHLLLNVPAGRLSIDPARPGDFHAWALETGRASAPGAFLPRTWFGAYAADRLAQAVSGNPLVELVHRREGVASVVSTPEGVRATGLGGSIFHGDHAVLALGHGPIRTPAALAGLVDDPRVLRGPWDREALAGLATRAERVLLVGTGLTMFDAAIGLRRAGFTGDLVAVSRRGLAARAHGPKDEAAHAAWASGLAGRSLRELIRSVRDRGAGGDWRGVVDSMRPHTAAIWAGLSERDRRRFLGRVAVLWDVHRHRAPASVCAEIEQEAATGRLRFIAGGLTGAHVVGDRIAVRMRPRHAGERTVYTDGVVLCTGAEPDPRRWGSPLIEGLFGDGLASPDPLGLGLRSDAHGFLLGADGRAHGLLSTIGPLRRGDLWESTAVPEIARQAAALAERLLAGGPALSRTGPPAARLGPAVTPRPIEPS